jgi:hypothetical protein
MRISVQSTAALCSILAVAVPGCGGEGESTVPPSPAPAATTTAATTASSTTQPPSTDAPTTTTTAAQAAPAPPLFGQTGALAAGTYLVDKFGTPLHVTVPAGWTTFGDFALMSPEGFEAGYLGFWDVDDVNLDACHWNGRANVGPSVDELVAGLVGQLGMDVTAPTAIEVDGRAGQAVTLSPADVDPATCDEGTVSPWFEADGDSRFYAAPGETETVWIVDLDGHRAVLNAGSVVDVAPATRAQLDDMLASIRIG